MKKCEKLVRDRLFEIKDEGYRDFVAKLMPTVDKETIIGIRTPQMQAFVKELLKMPEAEGFIAILPHKYFEEYNVHGAVIAKMKDFDKCVAAVDAFLPYVNNWATCDSLSPKIFAKHTDELLPYIKRWIASGETYTVRFGIGTLMGFYLDDKFKKEYATLVASVRSEEYYINMMKAWYFATALAKHYDEILPYIEKKKLDTWSHNKSIQKAIESYRITDEQKTYLRTLKIKKEN